MTEAVTYEPSFWQRVRNLTSEESLSYIDDIIDAGKKPANDEGVDLILARAARDTMFFGLVFMPDTFSDAMTWQNLEQWKLLDNERLPRVCQCMWRGGGKSTSWKTKAVKGICQRQMPYILPVGKTADFITQESEFIKQELLSNHRIKYIYGNFRTKVYEDIERSFSKKSWFASDPDSGEPFAFINPRGMGQQVRGTNVRLGKRPVRPTDIFISDLEDAEDVLSEEYRAKVRAWVYGDLLNCVNTRQQPDYDTGLWPKDAGLNRPWRIYYDDTLKHEASFMAHILNDSSWHSVVLPLCEYRRYKKRGGGNYYSLVPELVSDAQVRAEAEAAKKGGWSDSFAREKMCLPVPPGDAIWLKDDYKYYRDEEMNINRDPGVDRFIIVDPSKSATPQSAKSAALCGGADVGTGKIYLRALINERIEPDEFINRVYDLSLRMNTPNIFVEHTGGSDMLKHMWRNEANKRGLSVNLQWLTAHAPTRYGDYGTGKDAVKRARAAQIIPYYNRGYVIHDESLRNSGLEMQQLSYPKCSEWDALDCAGYIPQVLEVMGRYFIPQIQEQDMEDYDDLSGDPELEAMLESGEWRML